MKKYFLLTFFVLLGCTQMSSMDILPTSRERNEKCMEMRRFKVFQVFEDYYALANACTADYDDFCIGAVVLLAPQKNMQYYDDMYVSAPANKCAIQDGIYKYETKNKTHKTVPIVDFDYEFSASSEEEEKERFLDYMEDLRYECKLSVTNDKKKNTKANINKCDCVVDFIKDEILNFKDRYSQNLDKNTVIKEFYDKIEKKCGKIPAL